MASTLPGAVAAAPQVVSMSSSPSTPRLAASRVDLQTILERHGDDPASALHTLIQDHNRLCTQVNQSQSSSSSKNGAVEAQVWSEREELTRSFTRLQDDHRKILEENRKLWQVMGVAKKEAKEAHRETSDLRHKLQDLELRFGLTPTSSVSPLPDGSPADSSGSHRPNTLRANSDGTPNGRRERYLAPSGSTENRRDRPPRHDTGDKTTAETPIPFLTTQGLGIASTPQTNGVPSEKGASPPTEQLTEIIVNEPVEDIVTPTKSPKTIRRKASSVDLGSVRRVEGLKPDVPPARATTPPPPASPHMLNEEDGFARHPTTGAADSTSDATYNDAGSPLATKKYLVGHIPNSPFAPAFDNSTTKEAQPFQSNAAAFEPNSRGAASMTESSQTSSRTARSSSNPVSTQPSYAPQPSSSIISVGGEQRRLLASAHLPFTTVRVTGSHIRSNERSKEVISFSIGVIVSMSPEVDPDGNGRKASWFVEKLYSDVLALDQTIKTKISKSNVKCMAQLPDRALFKDHAPSKVDARKYVLQKYLQTLCSIPMSSRHDLCHFFNSNVQVDPKPPVWANAGHMEGYLTKKGRNFGGWQTRFYVLDGPVLEYFDSNGGARLGHISIVGAQIGRQQQRVHEAGDDSYRHAFLIRMQRREREAEVDHILCAESDEERDAWVQALTCYVSGRYLPPEGEGEVSDLMTPTSSQIGAKPTQLPENSTPTDPVASKNTGIRHGRLESAGQSSVRSGVDGVVPPTAPHRPMDGRNQPPTSEVTASQHAYPSMGSMNAIHKEAPVGGSSVGMRNNGPSPSQTMLMMSSSDGGGDQTVGVGSERASTPDPQSSSSSSRPKISGPMNGAPIAGGYRIRPPEEKRAKFKSAFWGFAGRSTHDKDKKEPSTIQSQAPLFAPTPRPVFGVSLQEAVSVARVREGLDLPAVIYRCVEYLEARGALEEEGIYRLSGSSTVIKSLKERFNTEGDFNLVEAKEYFDVHAISGLLKQFLRELSTPILTRNLHSQFLQVIDLKERTDKVNELGRLCSELPLANYTLLRFLSAHLIHIINNESVNKMSMRNVGIVFSPTLGMPAPLFALLLREFDLVFNIEDGDRAPIMISDSSPAPQSSMAPTMSILEKIRNRNSIMYSATGADTLMEHSRLPEAKEEFEESDDDVDYNSGSEQDESLVAPSRHVIPQQQPQQQQAPPHQLSQSTTLESNFSNSYGQPPPATVTKQVLTVSTSDNHVGGAGSNVSASSRSPSSYSVPRSPAQPPSPRLANL